MGGIQITMANIPTANNNPGDIRGADGNFIKFATPLEGQAALYNDLTTKMTGKSRTGLKPESTLYEFVQKYAPKGDGGNDPLSYTAALANQLKVSPDTKLSDLMPRIDDFAKAIADHEGYKGPWTSGNPDMPKSANNGSQFNPAPFSTGVVDESQIQAPTNKGTTYPNSSVPLTTGPVKAAFEQTGQALGHTVTGMAKAGAAGLNGISKFSQGLMSKLTPGYNKKNDPVASLPNKVVTPTKEERPGFVGAQIGAALVPGEAATEAAGTSLPALASKAAKLAWKHKVTAGVLYELATNPKGAIKTVGKLIDLLHAP